MKYLLLTGRNQNQPNWAQKQMLKDHGMDTANAVKSPFPKTADVLPARENKQVMDEIRRKEFWSMIKSLFYLAICTRPDISCPIAVLARQVHSP